MNDTDSYSLRLGAVQLGALNFNNGFTLIDVNLTLVSFGVYTQYLDVEFYLGSIGITLGFENGRLSFGFSFGLWGFKIAIRFW